MIRFFITHKKTRGVITVFLTIIYLFAYMMIGVFVDGGRIRMASAMVEDVQQVATENAMSQYNRGLYEYYGLFGVSDYDIKSITEDVQAQIKQSLGLNIKEDTIKSFILDIWTGGNSAIKNIDIIDKEAMTIEDATKYKDKIVSDINELKKRFDPYGINLKYATASYIDLSNTDALRAQIRDEMRYSAYLLAAENLFSVVNQFIEIANGTNTVLDITKTIASASDCVNEIDKKYQVSLDNATKEFNKLVNKCYNTETGWAKVKSVFAKIGDGFLSNIKLLIDRLKNKNNNKTEDDNEYEIETNLNIKLEEEGSNDNEKDNGLLKVVKDNGESLKVNYENFDNPRNWDDDAYMGETYYYADESDDEDEESEPYYHKSEHLDAVSSLLGSSDSSTGIIGTYIKKIREIRESINNVSSKIDISLNLNESYTAQLSKVIDHFSKECDKAVENGDELSSDIYAPFIESNLRQWKNLRVQREALERLKCGLMEGNTKYTGSLINEISDAEKDVNRVKDEIYDEINAEEEDWNDGPHVKLAELRNSHAERFHSLMCDMVENEPGIKTFQRTANGKTKTKNIFKLLKTITGTINDEKEKMENMFSGLGKIEEENKVKESGNKIFDYDEYLKSQKDLLNNSDFQNDDSVFNEFTEDKIYDQVAGIFSKANEIVANIANGMFANLYDESYILTNFRDYVHTKKYKENGYDHLTENEIKDKKIDTVFNKKFVYNMSETKYFTDEEFKDIETTPAEIEYILWGIDDTKLDLGAMYTSIFTIRLALNYIAVFTSMKAKGEISALAAATFIGAPVVTAAAPLLFALPQSCYETGKIFDCEKVNLWNGNPNIWENGVPYEVGLFDGFKNIVVDGVDNIKDKVIEECNNVITSKIEEVLNDIEDINQNPEDEKISFAVKLLKKMIDDDIYKPVTDVANKINTNSVNVGESKIKAGYSDYLSIFLFVNGMANKEGQMKNMQNIIQTNMRKAGQKEFDMAKTYSQISVDTKSSIKYIFMTQSFMRRTFSAVDEYNDFPLNIKTSFAY